MYGLRSISGSALSASGVLARLVNESSPCSPPVTNCRISTPLARNPKRPGVPETKFAVAGMTEMQPATTASKQLAKSADRRGAILGLRIGVCQYIGCGRRFDQPAAEIRRGSSFPYGSPELVRVAARQVRIEIDRRYRPRHAQRSAKTSFSTGGPYLGWPHMLYLAPERLRLDRSPVCGVDPVWWRVCHLGRLGFLEYLRLACDWG